MTTRSHQTTNTRKQPVSTAPAQGMFQSRPFEVRSDSTTELQQQPDLKTSLMQAERYGHHLNRMHFSSVSAPKAVQPKMGAGKTVEYHKAEAPQVSLTKLTEVTPPDWNKLQGKGVVQRAKAPKARTTNRPQPYPTQRPSKTAKTKRKKTPFKVELVPTKGGNGAEKIRISGRPKEFNQQTLAELARRHPNEHLTNTTNLQPGYSRNHIVPWLTIRKGLANQTRGFNRAGHEAHIRGLDANQLTNPRYRNQLLRIQQKQNLTKADIEKAYRLSALHQYNNVNNLYVGNSSKNSSDGATMRARQERLAKIHGGGGPTKHQLTQQEHNALKAEFKDMSIDIPKNPLSTHVSRTKAERLFQQAWGRTPGKYT